MLQDGLQEDLGRLQERLQEVPKASRGLPESPGDSSRADPCFSRICFENHYVFSIYVKKHNCYVAF